MSSLEDIRSIRLQKLHLLNEVFGACYPSKTHRTHAISDIQKKHLTFLRSGKKVTIDGRVRSLRSHGGSSFFNIEEDYASIQCFIRREDIGDKSYDLFINAIDIGDILEVTGKAYATKRKEKSVLVSAWRPLAKALLPLPEKWHGLQNVEERYRKRALDLLSNKDVRSIFVMRSKTITFLRNYLDSAGFLEVESPMLHPISGGATARPFSTHHNALDMELFLRIAPELYLKRLIVGGFDGVYEISRNFRNEGIDVTHNPEFTMLEAYIAWQDYIFLNKFVEIMIKKLIKKMFGKSDFIFEDHTIKTSSPFKQITFYEAIERYALMPSAEKATRKEIEISAKRYGLEINSQAGNAMILEDIFRKAVRPYLIQPTFVRDWPSDLLPLAKKTSKDEKLAESFQLYIGGIELVKAFSELNDPIDQRKRFQEQEELRKMGDDEASPIDEDFLENLEYGMPPTAGFGLGIDRLVMLISNMRNIREVILFPTLRPKS